MDTKCEATGDAPVSDQTRRRTAFEFAFQIPESLACGYEH